MSSASRIHPVLRALPALVAALLAHLAIAVALGVALELAPVEPLPPAAALAPVSLLTEEAPASDATSRQFVSLPAPDEESRPDDARFLDRYDRSVEQETVNRNDTLVASAAPTTSRAEAAAAAGNRAAFSAGSVASRRSSGDASSDREAAIARPPEPGGSAPPEAGGGRGESSTGDGVGDGESETGEGARPGAVDLRQFNAVGAGSDLAVRRNDHLELAEGDRTALNSLRSTYWSFFNRMQERLSAEWRPNAVLRRYDPTGELYGRRDRYTVLSVTLEGDGSLRHAVVARSSELDFLDAEAIRAFEATAPFPNVPESLRDEQGRVTFRFGFYVNYGGSGRIRRLP